jgi:hypothetical protein
MRKVIVIAAILLLLSTAAIVAIVRSKSLFVRCSKHSVSRIEAQAIATKKLQEYCEREGISTTQFPAPDVHSSQEVPWIFDYTSTTTPRHFVRVHIDECGIVELSREVYDR